MRPRLGFWLLLCTAICFAGGSLATTAGAEEGEPATVSELPPVVGEVAAAPAEVQGDVEAAVGSVAPGAPEPVRPPSAEGSAATPPAGGADHSRSEGGGTVGKVVGGAGKTVESAGGAVREAVGAAGEPASPAPSNGSTATAPEPAPVETSATLPPAAAAATGESTTTATATEQDRRVPSPSRLDPGSRATPPSSASEPASPQARTLDGSQTGTPSAPPVFDTVAKAIAADAEATLDSRSASSQERGSSTASVAKKSSDEGDSFRVSDLVPHSRLGLIVFLLVLATGLGVVVLLVRREMGMDTVPPRLPHELRRLRTYLSRLRGPGRQSSSAR